MDKIISVELFNEMALDCLIDPQAGPDDADDFELMTDKVDGDYTIDYSPNWNFVSIY